MKNHMKPKIIITQAPLRDDALKGKVCAQIDWTNVPEGVQSKGFSICGLTRELAERYKKAVEAGKIYSNPIIVEGGGMEDPLTGKIIPPFKYIKYDGFVMGKYLNSDLKKLGY